MAHILLLTLMTEQRECETHQWPSPESLRGPGAYSYGVNLGGTVPITCSIDVSNDGTRIVSGSDDKSVRVWDASTRKPRKMLNNLRSWFKSGADAPYISRAVSHSDEPSLRGWDWVISTGKELEMLKGHTSWVSAVAFSNDGSRIVSGSADESVRVWDALVGEELKVLKGHTGSVISVAFSNDGMRIVSGPNDNSVQVWDWSISPRYLQVQRVGTASDGERNDGRWLASPFGEDYLMFLPMDVTLPDASGFNTLIISLTPPASVDFKGAKLGTQWCECYQR